VDRLNGEIVRILGDADVRQRWAPIGLEPAPTTPAEFDRIIRQEVALFTKIARAANIRAN
jgi:tripartite-type tricarboxylate transporter receptor subunit TctC